MIAGGKLRYDEFTNELKEMATKRRDRILFYWLLYGGRELVDETLYSKLRMFIHFQVIFRRNALSLYRGNEILPPPPPPPPTLKEIACLVFKNIDGHRSVVEDKADIVVKRGDVRI